METVLNSPALLFLTAATAIAFWYLLDYYCTPQHLPDEPLVVSSSIPYIGHIIGLIRHGTRYYEITRCVSSHLSTKEESSTYFSVAPNASSQYTP
jgi:hypothetical protein